MPRAGDEVPAGDDDGTQYDHDSDARARDRCRGARGRAAKVTALREVIDLLRPVAATIARDRNATLGHTDAPDPGEDSRTHDTHESFTLARVSDTSYDAGHGCGDTEGYVLLMRADGTLWGAPTSGRYWSGAGGGETWRAHLCELAAVTVEDAARHVSPEEVLRTVLVALEQRRGQARDLAWRRQRIAKALAAVSQPA